MKPLSEHPNPQFERKSYLCLNGEWDYKITQREGIPSSWDGKIVVPYSPESPLSGVNHILQPDENLFYRLQFQLDDDFIKEKVVLHFLGVDQTAKVYLNGHFLIEHIGGFLPFEVDIKQYLEEGVNSLIVKVKDVTDKSYHSRGKQRLKHGGIWYTPQSGIFLPVYIESVPYIHVKSFKITPDIDRQEIVINVKSTADVCELSIFDEVTRVPTNEDIPVPIKDMHLWSPEDPYLYPIKIKVRDDEVTSYFAMRKFSIMNDENNIPRLALNNKPIFMKGILDQGYYQKGLLTPPSYEDYVKDIELVKALGFNMIRKHIKIEIPRWYYECDKRGMIVWQDFVNGGSKYHFSTIAFPLIFGIHHKDNHYARFSRRNKEGRIEAINEFKQTIDYLYNFPCIALWTVFNEGWGQFDSKKIVEELKAIDNSRLYDHASGWHDQGIGELKSMHVYFKRVKLPKKENRCIILSEFGGLVLPVEGHRIEGNSVYKKFNTIDEYLNAYKEMIEVDVIKNIPLGLSATVYTQLSDVEEETNGFITYDREVVKLDPIRIKEINDQIHL